MTDAYKKILLLLLIILASAILYSCGLMQYITLENLKAIRLQLLVLVENHYLLALLTYIALYILASTFSLPVGAPLTLIGGFLFGTWIATIATNIGATIGASLTFLLVRYLLADTFQKQYSAQLTTFNANIAAYGAQYLLLARLMIFIPFFLVNIGAALTNVPLLTFIVTTSLGIMPGSLVYAYAGSNIATINRISDVFSRPMIIALLLLIGCTLLSIMGKHFLIKKYSKK